MLPFIRCYLWGDIMANKTFRFVRATSKMLIDMLDGTHAERVVASPPPDMMSGDRLKVEVDEPIEATFPASMIVGDRLKVDIPNPAPISLPAALINANRVKVEVDDPIDVNLPAALINANRLKVEVDDPIDVTLPASLINAGRLKVQVDSPNPLPISLPLSLLTDGGGASARLRVDQGETGFFAGKMFRSFFNGVIPKAAGSSIRFRFTSPIDFILWVQELDLTQGALQLEVFTGVTPSGTWVSVPVIGVNRMAQRPLPYYVPQVTIDTSVGGTGDFTGGTRVDFLQNRTASTNGTASNVGVQFSERGLPAGAYYGRLQTLAGGLPVNDDSQFVYRLQWEERP